MALAPGGSLELSEAPPALSLAIREMRQEARSRYGYALVEVAVSGATVSATVALPGQAEELRRLFQEVWPEAELRVLVLASRRARLALYPDSEPLQVWKRPVESPAAGGELTTQLLPGDPPAELLAVRGGQYLVRAPGGAVGWVSRAAEFRMRPNPVQGPCLQREWDPRVVLETALSLLGRPYVWGGTGGPGVDCSGLSWRSFLAAGVLLPRNSRAQRQVGDRVQLAELAAADLVGAVYRGPRRTSHVAIALGGGELIHACSERGQVRRETVGEFRERYRILTVRRLPGARRPGR